jgi:hypothetical protein
MSSEEVARLATAPAIATFGSTEHDSEVDLVGQALMLLYWWCSLEALLQKDQQGRDGLIHTSGCGESRCFKT